MLNMKGFAKSVKFLNSADITKIERQLSLIKKNLVPLIMQMKNVDLIIKLSQI